MSSEKNMNTLLTRLISEDLFFPSPLAEASLYRWETCFVKIHKTWNMSHTMEYGRMAKWGRKESCGVYQYWFQRYGDIELYENN